MANKEHNSQDKNPRIGILLHREGFLEEEDLKRALEIQHNEKRLTGAPLGRIFTETKLLSVNDLKSLLNHPQLRGTIGSLAVRKGLITEDQLHDCLREKEHGKPLGEFLVQKGLITPSDLQSLITEQLNAPKLGKLALLQGLINQRDLEEALRIQKTPRSLGQILCDMGVISPLDLHYVVHKYGKQLKLGEILIKLNYIDEETLNNALMEQKNSSDSLGDILLSKKIITGQQLQEALSVQANIPFESLEGFSYKEEEKGYLTKIISRKYAEKNLILPVSQNDNSLILAVIRPESLLAAYELATVYRHLKISCILITPEKFNELFEILYSEQLGLVTSASTSDEELVTPSCNIDFMQAKLDEDMELESKQAPIYDNGRDIEAEEIVNFIISYAISNRASDIHIEQDREGIKLRYRIDGVLNDINIKWLKDKLQEKIGSIISRIKIISNLDIAEKRLPQDGVFRINYYDKTKGRRTDLDFRVATCKGITGENIVIRILDSGSGDVDLEGLDHSPHVLKPFKRCLGSSAGIILVTGPTGSGKSTTLYGALKYVYNPSLKIITAEDPIEYSFPGIMQTQIHPKIGLTFARLLRSFLRLDPDVILVGEIRDEETAKISFDAAQTGHLVLSTLHTNDSISSVSRLFDLGIDPTQIISSLSCVLAQRLVRKICPVCMKEHVPDEEEWSLFFEEYPAHLKFYKGDGCESCGFTGYKGRTLLSEVFMVDKDISKAIANKADADGLKRLAMEFGMKTMLDDALLKLRDTTLSEIRRVIPNEMIERFRTQHNKVLTKSYEHEEKLQYKDKYKGKGLILSDPLKDHEIIKDMYKKHTSVATKSNGQSTNISYNEFREFITESFNDICRKYGCSRVAFDIEIRNRRVEISALPY